MSTRTGIEAGLRPDAAHHAIRASNALLAAHYSIDLPRSNPAELGAALDAAEARALAALDEIENARAILAPRPRVRAIWFFMGGTFVIAPLVLELAGLLP